MHHVTLCVSVFTGQHAISIFTVKNENKIDLYEFLFKRLKKVFPEEAIAILIKKPPLSLNKTLYLCYILSQIKVISKYT